MVVAGSIEDVASFLEQNTELAGPIYATSAGLGGIIATLGGFATPSSTTAGYIGPMVGGNNGTVFLGSAASSHMDVPTGILLGLGGFAALLL